MARGDATVRGKIRTREHVLADLSINHVERQVLLCGFSADRVLHDYGYDLTVATYNHAGEVEPGAVYVQVKATDRPPRLAGGKTVSWPVSRRDLKLWLEEAYPVVLVVYDGQKDKACWIYVQAYLAGRRAAELFAGGETIRIRIPIDNRLTRVRSGQSHAGRTTFTSNSEERDPGMSSPNITFAQLRQLLLDLGFTETVTPKSHVFFAHPQSGAETALPIYRSNQVVMPHHLATVRFMLDGHGLLARDAFDDFVAATAAQQSAS